MSRKTDPLLRDEYLHWLEPQLRDEHGRPDKTYEGLLNVMFDKAFTSPIPMDENRLVDGKDLRVEFAQTVRGSNRVKLNVTDALLNMAPISFLEVLIALSRRLAFTAGGEAPGWAWQLLANLELDRMWDPLTRPKHVRIREIMDKAISRTYLPDGTGGFFPLAWPDDDQTRIELWYQLNSYAEELHPEH